MKRSNDTPQNTPKSRIDTEEKQPEKKQKVEEPPVLITPNEPKVTTTRLHFLSRER